MEKAKMTTYSIDTLQPKSASWHTLNRSAPVYRDMPPLPHAVPPKDKPLVLDFLAQRQGASPLQISHLADGRCVGGRRARAVEWLYHPAGAFAPATLTRFRAALSPDDEMLPTQRAVHFPETGENGRAAARASEV